MQNIDSNTNANSAQQRQVFTVSQLNRRTRQLLETHLPLIWVEGEISNFACPASGHWYFSLKDDNAQVRCAMFRNRNGLVRLPSGSRPNNGMQVLLRCRVSLYEGRGEFQLIVEHMEEAGRGALQRRFEELKARLNAEGLFADQYKQPLPALPRHIGVITSPTGAAVRDIVSVLERRFPAIPVTIYPVAVQGAEAVPEICQAIQFANQHQICDVLIVGRGGGSMEDLWAFNEEPVARAIFNSQIPIVSAVGHEVDFTIADFVADLRAPTPSAAAELLSPDQQELAASFLGYQRLLTESVQRTIQQQAQKLDFLRQRLRHPGDRLREQAQHLDHLEARLQTAMKGKLRQVEGQLNTQNAHLANCHPGIQLQQLKLKASNLQQRLGAATQNQLNRQQQRLASAAKLLNTVSPLNTLERGYAIVQDEQEKVVTSVNDVEVGAQITSRVTDGLLHCEVLAVKPANTSNSKAID